MTKQFIFDVWAPDGAKWSRWVKPVLFACMDGQHAPWVPEPVTWDTDWTQRADVSAALVLDLPGRDAVIAGLALAERGYRPVPLFNALPAPTPGLDPDELLPPLTVVEVRGIMEEIARGTERLQALALGANAPPAFLLDWDRRGDGRQLIGGSFDNRSVSFTTDFPSANFLQAHGIQRIVLVQPSGDVPQTDLAHTLRRWQEAGLAVELKRLDGPYVAVPCKVPKPPWFGWMWQRTLVAIGLRRGEAGGFGNWVPEPSSG